MVYEILKKDLKMVIKKKNVKQVFTTKEMKVLRAIDAVRAFEGWFLKHDLPINIALDSDKRIKWAYENYHNNCDITKKDETLKNANNLISAYYWWWFNAHNFPLDENIELNLKRFREWEVKDEVEYSI